MNWVCESCGYENEYNDESQPTECLCCGEPASEHQLNQAKQELEKYHKEQARQRRLEQLRQEAIKQQEKIEHSIDAFAKGIKGIAAAFMFDVKEDEQSVELLEYVKEHGIEEAVTHFTEIEKGSRIFDEIIKNYHELEEKSNK